MTDDTSKIAGLQGMKDATDIGEHPHASLFNRITNLLPVWFVAMVIFFGGTVTSGFLSIALFGFGLLLFLAGSYMVLSPPTYRFEVGKRRGSEQYEGVEIAVEVDIRYDENDAKQRTVECVATAEDGTTITRESDTEQVGSKPKPYAGGGYVDFDGGDFDDVRSTPDHILSLATPVREYIDEWLVAEGNDMEIKSTLEEAFDTTDDGIDQALEAGNP